jgi:hypothetical protein
LGIIALIAVVAAVAAGPSAASANSGKSEASLEASAPAFLSRLRRLVQLRSQLG